MPPISSGSPLRSNLDDLERCHLTDYWDRSRGGRYKKRRRNASHKSTLASVASEKDQLPGCKGGTGDNNYVSAWLSLCLPIRSRLGNFPASLISNRPNNSDL